MQWFLFTVWFLIWKVCLNNLVAVAFCKKSASTVCETSCCHKLRAYDAQTSPTWLSIFQSKWKCLPNTVDVLFPYLIWDTNNTSNACQLHAHSMKLISMHGMTFTCCMNHSCLKITVRVLWVDIDGLKRQMALWIIMRANRLAVYLHCQFLGTEQKLSVMPCISKGKFRLVRHSSIPVCCQSLLWCRALERNLIIREQTFTMNQYRRTGQNLCLFLSQSQ